MVKRQLKHWDKAGDCKEDWSADGGEALRRRQCGSLVQRQD